MHRVENAAAQFEQLLNPVDWVPLASSFSGIVRVVAGGVQVVAAVAFVFIKASGKVWTGKGSYKEALKQGILYSFHGVTNIGRGYLAMYPGLNLILLVHDRYLGRINYEREIVGPQVYPLMTAHRYVVYY